MHESTAASVRQLRPRDAASIVDVLCEAFHDYPVMRFVLGAEDDYAERLRTLIGLFVAARALNDDVMLGIHDRDRLVAVVTTSNPATPAHPDFADVRDAVWQRLGANAQRRYELCVRAWSTTGLDVRQLHVNMIGVRDAYRGSGLARRLFNEVHALAERSPWAEGVSLTTEVRRNVDLYRHLGYEVVGEASVTSQLHVWNMFRRTLKARA